MFPNYAGVPYRGTETDKRNTILVSRVACLFQLGHESIGFTGPLNRGLLAYSGMICAILGAMQISFITHAVRPGRTFLTTLSLA